MINKERQFVDKLIKTIATENLTPEGALDAAKKVIANIKATKHANS